MRIVKNDKYRLAPTPEQEQTFRQWAGCRRFIWNWALQRRQEHYNETKQKLTYQELCIELSGLKRELPWLKQADSQCLQQTLRDLDNAYKNFFEKRAGFPKKKSRKRTPNAFRIPQRVSADDGKCLLPKIGSVKMICHRPLDGVVKSATIKQEANDKWNVTFTSHHDLPDVEPQPVSNPVGIDLGLDTFVTLSTGEKRKAPRFFRTAQQKVRLANRRHSRKQQGSRNRAKARKRLARVHAKVRQQRNDYLHKLSTELVVKHDLICLEDLNISALAKTKLRGHAKSWLDGAYGSFARMLQYKSDWNFKRVVFIDRYFPSTKRCHVCHECTVLTLSDRVWQCSHCQTMHDRDHNAAINIAEEGLRLHRLTSLLLSDG